MSGLIIITRKQARAILDVLGEDNPETGKFFELLLLELDSEQAIEPEDRKGILIQVTGTEM